MKLNNFFSSATPLVWVAGVAIVFGFLSGLAGYLIFGQLGLALPFLGRVSFDDLDRDQQIVIDQPRNVIVEQDLQLKRIENELLPTLVSIYPSQPAGSVMARARLPQEATGLGLVLTADGWVLSVKSAINSLSGQYQAIGYQSKQYGLANFIKDSATNIIFGKMNAADLPVIKLGSSRELTLGQTLVVARRQELIPVQLVKIGYSVGNRNSLIQSADILVKQLFLNLSLDASFDCAPLANMKGELVGIVDNGQVIPVDYFKNLISQALDKQKLSRPILGLKYLDLSQTDGLIYLAEKGAYVYASPAKDSPALGLLKEGDIIKKVDDQELNFSNSLSEVINGYKSGSRVEFLISRQNQEKTVAITLK